MFMDVHDTDWVGGVAACDHCMHCTETSTTSFFNSFSFIFVTGTGTLTLTQEQAEMANGYDALMRDALAASQCSGCLPDPSREAYAFVTWGSKKADGSLGGLRAAVASIRLHDTTRDIVVLDVVEDEMASVSPSLVALSQRFRVRRVVNSTLTGFHCARRSFVVCW